jgi:hypothetical protein
MDQGFMLRCFRAFWRVSLTSMTIAVSIAAEGSATEAPLAPETSTGAYSVGYSACVGCYTDWLEEREGQTGAWVAVGQGTVSFNAKPDGTYYYRSAYLWWGSDYSSTVDYSAVATVVVGDDLPQRQRLGRQLRHRYEVRVGDLDADGRRDLFIDRVHGGDRADGTLEQLVLRGTDNRRLDPLTPSAAQSSLARTWPQAGIGVELRDVNIDGFADLLLTGIDRIDGFGQTRDQIVFAPAEILRKAPLAVRAVNSKLLRFGDDIRDYLVEPEFFRVNAPIVIVAQTYWDLQCRYDSFDFPYYSSLGNCYPIPITGYYVLPDYSGFSEAAIEVWYHEYAMQTGEMSTEAGYLGIEQAIEDLIRVDLGGWKIRELLGESVEVLDRDERRGLELFSALAGIANAHAQQVDEGAGGGSASDNVLLTGRRILGFGPFHTALQYGQSTVSAHDSDRRSLVDGILVSQVNWPNDHPALMMRLGIVVAGVSAPLYWSRVLAADGNYSDALPYDTFPSIGAGGYNSNSYVAGIVRATNGQPSMAMSRFVGGELPVQRSEFD